MDSNKLEVILFLHTHIHIHPPILVEETGWEEALVVKWGLESALTSFFFLLFIAYLSLATINFLSLQHLAERQHNE